MLKHARGDTNIKDEIFKLLADKKRTINKPIVSLLSSLNNPWA